MKTAFLGTLALVAIIAAPAVSLAAVNQMYQYVNTSGNLETISADSAAQALALPTDRNPHSGVALVSGVMTTTVVSSGVAGTYTGMNSSAGTSLTMGLVLEPNGTAALATNYQNGQVPTVETGTWMSIGTNQVQLTLTGTPTQTYSPSHIIIFNENGTTLTATQYDNSLYGTSGLTFIKES